MKEQFDDFLEKRWPRLLNRDIQYCQDYVNPANIMCTEIGKLTANRFEPFLPKIMPTLSCVSLSDYITSRWDEDIDLKTIILNDDNDRIISIPDVIDFASRDGLLKHNSLFNQQAKLLSVTEHHRFLSRHPTVENYYHAVQDYVNFTMKGETAGAYLQRLINGLKAGGITEFEDEDAKDDNSGHSANIAIVEFAEYLKRLPKEVYETLMSASKTDRDNSGVIRTKDIRHYWDLLCRPYNESIRTPKDLPTRLCVDLNGGYLQEILDDHPELFLLIDFQTDLPLVTDLQNKIHMTKAEMNAALAGSIQYRYYGDEDDLQLVQEMLPLIDPMTC